ncbi:MAG: hypothetical protein TREMPRED_004124 [Tremellales sp. Tagirdzhanova-0007]|nr:MAG: hypothetical protein TREMPRED_004124 [Tremellales sp. Tagirdzhanova-0007]
MSEAELRKKATKVTGQKDPMCAHFLGTRGKIACQHVLASVIASAKRWRQADKQIDTASSSAGSKRDVPPSSTNSSASQLNDKKVRQTSLVLFKGLSFPFTEEQKAAIAKQTLRATISAAHADSNGARSNLGPRILAVDKSTDPFRVNRRMKGFAPLGRVKSLPLEGHALPEKGMTW